MPPGRRTHEAGKDPASDSGKVGCLPLPPGPTPTPRLLPGARGGGKEKAARRELRSPKHPPWLPGAARNRCLFSDVRERSLLPLAGGRAPSPGNCWSLRPCLPTPPFARPGRRRLSGNYCQPGPPGSGGGRAGAGWAARWGASIKGWRGAPGPGSQAACRPAPRHAVRGRHRCRRCCCCWPWAVAFCALSLETVCRLGPASRALWPPRMLASSTTPSPTASSGLWAPLPTRQKEAGGSTARASPSGTRSPTHPQHSQETLR